MSDKILVADDDADNRRIMQLALSAAGYEVRLACDGREALASAASERPDLIVMDLSMPVLSGWEAVRLLKADPALRGIPVLAFTAHAMAGDDRRAKEAGCDGYLSKPCTPREAVAAVAAQLPSRARERAS
jgi:two-component system cell cycle response regulator DivK